MSSDESPNRRPAVQRSVAGNGGSLAGRSSAFGRPHVLVRHGATPGPPQPGNPRVSTRRSPRRSWTFGRLSPRNRSRPPPSPCSSCTTGSTPSSWRPRRKPPSSGPPSASWACARRGPTRSCARSAAHADLEAWFRQKVLAGMDRGRIGRGRQTRPSPLADAFFIALAGGEPEARNCARCLAGAARADLQAAARDDPDQAASEVRDYLVHSRLLWRLRPDGG